jgi:hypothetical protein
MKLQRKEKLLLDCLKARNGAGLEQLSASDWGLVGQQSVKYTVSPLVYEQIKDLALPDELMEELRESYLSTAASNVRHYHDLAKVLGMLKEEGISVIVLKGAHLAEIVYGNIGLRPMCDVDLLVRKDDLSMAQTRLIEAGYYPFNSRLPLDIHWSIEHNIVPPLPIDIKGIWERAEVARIAGVEVLVLSPEDLLLHLCIHLSFHHLFEYAGVRSLCDITETIRHYEGRIDWNVIRDRAKTWRANHAVELSLLLARELLDADIPETVLPKRKAEYLDSQAQWAMRRIFNGASGGDQLSPFFCFLWRPVSMRQKAAHFFKFMFPPSEHVSERFQTPHGSTRNYVSYVTRVREHFGNYARATWKILTRDAETMQQVTQQNQNTAMREWLSSN